MTSTHKFYYITDPKSSFLAHFMQIIFLGEGKKYHDNQMYSDQRVSNFCNMKSLNNSRGLSILSAALFPIIDFSSIITCVCKAHNMSFFLF